MKYYLKDKNGTIHTESNENKFKLALKYQHKKNEQANIIHGPGGTFGSLRYPADNEDGYIPMGVWNIGYPKIHIKYDWGKSTDWEMVTNSNIICYDDILIGNTNLISNRDISNDIIIKYNTNFNKIATYDEMINDDSFGKNNDVLTYNYLRNNPQQNTYNIINYRPGGTYLDMESNCWQVDNKITHTTTNLSNKYYTENTVTFGGSQSFDYFTLDVTKDWNTYSKIRLRVKLLVNIQTDDANVLDVNTLFGDIKNHTNSGLHTAKPFIFVARTTDNETLSNETDKDESLDGCLMFYSGDTKGDTITSFDEESYKDNRSERTYDSYNQNLVDLNTYVSYSDDVYYIYKYISGETKYYVTRDEIYNYLNTTNPRFNIMTYSDFNSDGLVLNHGTDIKDLDEIYKTYTGDENWYETTLNLYNPFKDSNDEYKFTFRETSDNDCYNVYVEGYFDINVSELKKYLHIGFPFITGLEANGTRYNTTTVSNLEMSVEGVN